MIKTFCLKIVISLLFKDKSIKQWVHNNFLKDPVDQSNFLNNKKRQRIYVVITPWLNTAAPFFSAQIAKSIERKGFQVGYLFDLETGFKNINREKELQPLKRIILLFRILKQNFFIIDEPKKIQKKINYSKISKKLYFENCVKKFNGEEEALKRINYSENPYYLKIKTISENLIKNNIKELVIPGGVFGWSGAYVAACQQIKIPFWTYDSGEGLITLGKNSIASHFENFAATITLIKCKTTEKKKIKKVVKKIFFNKNSGIDFYGYLKNSRQADSNQFRSDALMLLNYRCDTAAMLRTRLFPNVQSWIFETAKWFNKNKLKLLIRRHPCEKDPALRSNDNYDFLQKMKSRYVEFVNYDNNINTYSLISKTKIVLPFTSTVGIESLYLGRPIILNAHAYYKNLSGAFNPKSQSDYFKLIKKTFKKKNKTKTFETILAYYLSDKCLFQKTCITPLFSDFKTWAHFSSEKIDNDKGFKLFLDCICKKQNFIFECFKKEIKK
jgi:hypothetical protein